MGSVFTREERAVVLFLTVSLLVGSALVQARRVFPESVPDFAGATESPDSETAASEQPTGPVDINTAGVDQLVRLPGIGPVRAGEIVRQRTLRGRYATLDELLDVKGIGPVTLDGLREHATVGGGPTSEADSCRTVTEPGS